jgi:hypothetical protein
VNFGDAVFGESAALEADFVHAVGVGVAGGGGHGEGQDVLRDGGASADVGVGADAHELMHGAERSDDGPLFDGDVAGDGRSVDQHDVIFDEAVVADVGVGHDEQMAADFGEASAFDGAAIDGDAFADFVVIADFEARGLVVVGDVLRSHADGGVGEKRIVVADFGWAFDGDVGAQAAVFSEFDVGADDAVGADVAGCGDFGAGVDDGGGVNVHECMIAGCKLIVFVLR